MFKTLTNKMADNDGVYDELSKEVVQYSLQIDPIIEEINYVPSKDKTNILCSKPKSSNSRDSRKKPNEPSKARKKVNYHYPFTYKWLGILILIGGILIFLTELLVMYLMHYHHMTFYTGFWVSWFVIITGILQMRLSEHYTDVGLAYQIITFIMSCVSMVLLIIGFVILIWTFVNCSGICENLVLIMIFEVTLTVVPVIISVCCVWSSCRKMKSKPEVV